MKFVVIVIVNVLLLGCDTRPKVDLDVSCKRMGSWATNNFMAAYHMAAYHVAASKASSIEEESIPREGTYLDIAFSQINEIESTIKSNNAKFRPRYSLDLYRHLAKQLSTKSFIGMDEELAMATAGIFGNQIRVKCLDGAFEKQWGT